MSKTPSYNEIMQQVAEALEGPISLDDFIARVLAIKPSQAKNPRSQLRTELQSVWPVPLLFLDEQTVIPTHIAMRGMRFAIEISRQEIAHSALLIGQEFRFYSHPPVTAESVVLEDADGSRLPTELVSWTYKAKTPFGLQTKEVVAFHLPAWFKRYHVQRDDFVIVTILDWQEGRYRLTYEKGKHRRQRRAEVEARNKALAEAIWQQLESARRQQIMAHHAVPNALARLPDPQGYPGDYWTVVLAKDGRMSTDGFMIRYAGDLTPIEKMLAGAGAIPTPKPDRAPVNRDATQTVYRFRASFKHRKGLWRDIEIQGKQTLGTFDSILRDAFDHDFSDHMGGFWKRVRRGASKRYREVELATINPFGEGKGADTQVAALGLAPGDTLIYVYDFGDWIEHVLELTAMGEPEAGGEYPRVVAQNKAQYRYCETCKEEERRTVAGYVCHTCSTADHIVYVCEEHAAENHEDHWTEEVIY